MARIFGDDVVVTLDDVHINHNTHQLVYRKGDDKDGLEHVATHQGLTPEVERAMEERGGKMVKANGVEHKEIVGETV
jgi:hypothetical protein